MNREMTVIVNGEEEKRKVSHVQKNPITHVFEDQPVLKAGETMSRDSNGRVFVYRGAHQ